MSLVLKEITLVFLSVAAGLAVWRMWPQRKLLALVVCLMAALLINALARVWGIDLSGVS